MVAQLHWLITQYRVGHAFQTAAGIDRTYDWSYVSGVIRRGCRPARMTPDTYDHHARYPWSYVSEVIPRSYVLCVSLLIHSTKTLHTMGRIYQMSYG